MGSVPTIIPFCSTNSFNVNHYDYLISFILKRFYGSVFNIPLIRSFAELEINLGI